jgi:hypothetical protein
VSEAFNKGGVPVANKVLRFAVKPDGTLGDKVVFKDFAADGTAYSDVDGMRTDTAGASGMRHEATAGAVVYRAWVQCVAGLL